jgi:hypothetical protein
MWILDIRHVYYYTSTTSIITRVLSCVSLLHSDTDTADTSSVNETYFFIDWTAKFHTPQNAYHQSFRSAATG